MRNNKQIDQIGKKNMRENRERHTKKNIKIFNKSGDNSILVTAHSFWHSQVFIHHISFVRSFVHQPSSLARFIYVGNGAYFWTENQFEIYILYSDEKRYKRVSEFSSNFSLACSEITQLKTYLIKTNATQ